MNKLREDKQRKIDAANASAKSAEIVLALSQSGLNASQTLELRRQMRAAGVELKVGKNTLVKRAIEGTGAAGLSQHLKGPIMLAFAKDPVAAAKTAVEFAKKNDKLKIVAAVFGGEVLDAKRVAALASLPSLNELRGAIVGLLVAPATKIARVLREPAAQLARVVAARGRQEA